MEKTKESPKKYMCSNPNILPSCSSRNKHRCNCDGECHLKMEMPTYQQIIDECGGEEEFYKLTNIKPNQKQYKEFDPYLFKTYINKFSRKDLLLAYFILTESINNCDE